MWEKSNNNNDSFSISDLDVDDEIIKNLIEKDISKSDETYKMK
jgi:hypothetical protein